MWHEEKLGKLIVVNQKTIGRNYPHKEIEYVDTSSANEGRIDSPQLLLLSEAPSRAKRIVSDSDIIYSTVRPNLKHFALIKQAKANLVASTGYAVISCKEKVDPGFVYAFLTTNGVIDYLAGIAEGQASTFPAFNVEVLEDLKIPLPPLPLQQRIAEVLGRYDALLENYQQQVAALEGLAQELYREWFVRGRCPGAEAGPGGELPAGWRTGKLRDIVAFYIGGGWGQEEPDDEHTIGGHVVRGTDIPNLKKGAANLDVYRYHKASNMNSRELQAGDIVFEVSGGSKDQGLGRNVLLTEQLLTQFGDKVMAASFCKLIRPDQEKTSAYYLQQLLDYLLENQEMAQYEVQSTGISNFQFEDFLDFQKVILPAKEALDRFDKIVVAI